MAALRTPLLILALCGLSTLPLVACSDDGGDDGKNGNDSASGGSGHTGTGSTGNGTGSNGDGGGNGGTNGNHEPPSPESTPFRFGLNLGHPNAAWGDDLHARLGARAGATSLRPKLPEYHLAQWGTEIEVGDMESYTKDSLSHFVAFVIGATREHSTMPDSAADWERDYYIPKNLHEPIWREDGTVNPDNYFAASLFDTMSVYGKWVDTWEIWNEPDWVPSWEVTQTWWDKAPSKDELVRFGGSVFDYVRMLRIACEVRDKAAPNTRVGLGGIGYPSFLDAVMRYTDEPTEGTVDDAHPRTGADYFDVVVFHYYPHFTPGNSDAGAQGLLSLKDDLAGVLQDYGVSDGSRGYVVTESGASHADIADTPSGAAYARNYMTKVMPLAHRAGIEGIHWFILSDAAGAPEEPFDAMGLYEDISSLQSIDDAVLTSNGVALRTLSSYLADAVISPAAAERAEHGADAEVVGYTLGDGRAAWVAWAVASSGESGTAELTLTSDTALTEVAWDGSNTGASESLASSGGKVTVSLTSSPVILTEPE